jgi:transposase InsO family protein
VSTRAQRHREAEQQREHRQVAGAPVDSTSGKGGADHSSPAAQKPGNGNEDGTDHPELIPADPELSDDELECFSVGHTNEVFCDEFNYTPVLGDVPLPETELYHPASREKRSKVNFFEPDWRTEDLDFRPGGEITWSMDLNIAQKIPSAFKHNLREKNVSKIAKRAKSRNTAVCQRNKVSKDPIMIEALVDSGADDLNIPMRMKDLLDDVTPIEPVHLNTAGPTGTTICESGTMRFRLEGTNEEFKLPCFLNPHTDLILFPSTRFERYDWVGTHRPRNIRVKTYKDQIKIRDEARVPLKRFGDSPSAYLPMEVVSGSSSIKVPPSCNNQGVRRRLVKGAHAARVNTDSYDLVHRLCAHSHEGMCRLTAAKAKGLPSLKGVEAPKRPCPCCVLSKMKQVAKGQGKLSDGLRPERSGQVLCGDTFGPINIPGLAGERYFLVLVCQFSRYGFVRAFKTLDEVPHLIELMIAEVRAALDADPQKVDITLPITLHTDNATTFKKAEHVKRMAELKVALHFSSPYDARTNPFAERHGGVLINTTRSLLLEGSYPAKFWPLLLRVAQWTLNRIVRKDGGKAPIEKFSGAEIDFSNVYPKSRRLV